jgi:hypothetical protein
LGTVPSAANASTASTAGTADALAAMEPTRLVGASGQSPFLDGSNSLTEGKFKFGPVGFYKDHEGIVHLTGAVKVGKEGTLKGLIFALPPGYRPASGVTEVFPGLEKSVVFIFGSNYAVAGQDLSGDVYMPGVEGKPEVLSGNHGSGLKAKSESESR